MLTVVLLVSFYAACLMDDNSAKGGYQTEKSSSSLNFMVFQ